MSNDTIGMFCEEVSMLTASGQELDQTYNLRWERDAGLDWAGYTTELVLAIEPNEDSSRLAIGESNHVGLRSPKIRMRCRSVKQLHVN